MSALQKYDKKPLSLDALLTHLESRGMVIDDRSWALKELSRIGYYRLKGYIHPFRQHPTDSALNPGTKFGTIAYYYEIDRDLRVAVLRGLERVEIGLRALLIERLTAEFGAFGHRNPDAFQPSDKIFDHFSWLSKLDASVDKDRHEAFVNHYRTTYDKFPEIPCWMAIEMTSFGQLSMLYYGCKREIRTDVASFFGLKEPVLRSWLHCLSHVRNICAHHARLWNRIFGVTPVMPKSKHDPRWTPTLDNRMFLRMAIIRALLDHLHDGDEWVSQMEMFKDAFAPRWVAQRMGFPYTFDSQGVKVFSDWTQHPLWKG